MDHHLRGQSFEKIGDEADVFLEFEHRRLAGEVLGFQRRIADDVQVVDFDAVKRQGGEDVGGGEHVVPRFARQTEDDMGANVERPALAAAHGVDEFRQTMAAIHPGETAVVNCLQAEFQAAWRESGRAPDSSRVREKGEAEFPPSGRR